MIKFAFQETSYSTDRVIGDLIGKQPGATAVFVGGIHGNEPSGVIAIQRMFEILEQHQIEIRGRVLGIVGNMAALASSQRFLSTDLNRIWNQDFFKRYHQGCRFESTELVEYREACAVFDIIAPLLEDFAASQLESKPRDYYFFDLHTTSGETVPFVAINDQLNNRQFALKFPVPTVLGIEEYLRGPLLSYINDIGPVALAFEAGQHDEPISADLHLAFILKSLVMADIISADQVPDYEQHRSLIAEHTVGQRGIFEVIHRHHVRPEDQFKMMPDFRNFMEIKRGRHLADDRTGSIFAPKNGRIFMPLYQSEGEDGFFIVRSVPYQALKLSSLLRRYNFERLLVMLPGVAKSRTEPDALVVNKRVARFLANQFFHLLGYRRKRDDGKTMTFVRREVGNVADDSD